MYRRLRLQTSKAFLPVLILYATIPGMIRGQRKIRAQTNVFQKDDGKKNKMHQQEFWVAK